MALLPSELTLVNQGNTVKLREPPKAHTTFHTVNSCIKQER